MSATSHPSANNRLVPIAEAFALRFDKTGFCSMYHRNILSLGFVTGYAFIVALRLISISTASTPRANIQSP